jgi:hypothetical protein
VRDSVLWVILLVGAVLMLPPIFPSAAVLHRFGRSAGIDFAYSEGGRLTAGPQAEAVLTGLVWRPTRAVGCFLVFVALETLLMRHGPYLSQSTVKSMVVAAVASAAILGPYLVLRQFLQPVSLNQPGTLRPGVSVEDYLSPPRRVVPWLAGATVLAVPVGAVALSMTEAYDGYKIYWEGLVALPLVSAGVLLAAELELLGNRDKVTDPALIYLWDALRGRSLRMITAVGVYGVSLSWEIAAGGVLGVARIQPFPAALPIYAVAVALAIVFKVGAFVLLLLPVGRFRGRLWPGIAPGTKLLWGAAAEETTAS